jgi:hypothetical protein
MTNICRKKWKFFQTNTLSDAILLKYWGERKGYLYLNCAEENYRGGRRDAINWNGGVETRSIGMGV